MDARNDHFSKVFSKSNGLSRPSVDEATSDVDILKMTASANKNIFAYGFFIYTQQPDVV